MKKELFKVGDIVQWYTKGKPYEGHFCLVLKGPHLGRSTPANRMYGDTFYTLKDILTSEIGTLHESVIFKL